MSLAFFILPLLVGIGIAGIGYAAWRIGNPYRTPTDRMAEFTGKVVATAPIQPSSIVFRSSIPETLQRVARLAKPTNPEELSLQRKAMLQAGFTSPNALEVYHVVRVLLAMSLPPFTVLPVIGMRFHIIAVVVLASAAVGYYLPALVVSQRSSSRKLAIARALPDALDLIVACTESGLGLDAAFDRVAEGIGNAAPILALELQIVGGEVSAGVPRIQALRRLDDRTGVPEISSLVNVLIQADRLGTPVAQALRVYASTARARRMLRAEEKAAAISPKLTVAMILFLLPSLFVVIIGPAIVRLIREVLPVLLGQT